MSRPHRPPTPGCIETAEHALEAATLATQDTVTVAIEGYAAAPNGETILFNMLGGVRRRLRAHARLDLGHPQRLVADQATSSVRGRHMHHFIPGILTAFAAGGAG